MKKKKKKRFPFKSITIFFLVQVVILAFFWVAKSEPLDTTQIKTATITVERTGYRDYWRSADWFFVYAKKEAYLFAPFPTGGTDEYSATKLRETISIGDRIEICYIEGAQYHWIVEASKGTFSLRSLEAYKHYCETNAVHGKIAFFMIEGLYLLSLGGYLWTLFLLRESPSSSERKRKKKQKLLRKQQKGK